MFFYFQYNAISERTVISELNATRMKTQKHAEKSEGIKMDMRVTAY